MSATRTIVLALAAAAFCLGGAACGGGSSADTSETVTTSKGGMPFGEGTLDGVVGPGFTISLSEDGDKLESIEAGTYTLNVDDRSDQHNFHLIGPGIDEKVTDVEFTGEKSATVVLEPGTYTYQCDPHASSGMKGTFRVTEG